MYQKFKTLSHFRNGVMEYLILRSYFHSRSADRKIPRRASLRRRRRRQAFRRTDGFRFRRRFEITRELQDAEFLHPFKIRFDSLLSRQLVICNSASIVLLFWFDSAISMSSLLLAHHFRLMSLGSRSTPLLEDYVFPPC